MSPWSTFRSLERGPTNVTSEAIARAAERLRRAAATGLPGSPVRDLIGSADIEAAYAVQNVNIAKARAEGRTVLGRKIGLTSRAVQQQIGVDVPDFGWLLDDMAYADGAEIPAGRVLQPKVEAEIAFVLRRDLAEGDLNPKRVREAVDYAVAAIEVCGSRIAHWDTTFGDTVADNASAGVYVLGGERRSLDDFDPVTVEMSMSVDGVEVSAGTGAACLGDPLEAVAWLARYARDFGQPLRAGQVILSGALGPMHPVVPGSHVLASLTSLGVVSASFADAPSNSQGVVT